MLDVTSVRYMSQFKIRLVTILVNYRTEYSTKLLKLPINV